MVFPKKLKKGSHIRVIAPSTTFKIISEETRKIALDRFKELGLNVSYAHHADNNESIDTRLEDLHNAFADPKVDAIFTAIGGHNSNQLINKIDYDLIKKNPKIICGFSDITALLGAIHAKTKMTTYYGPHFSTLGMKKGIEYTIEHLKKCLFEEKPYEIETSKEWSDDLWFLDQEKREFIKNDGHWIINQGKDAKGKLIGGNLCTFQLLHGTPYMPSIKNSILFVEDTGGSKFVDFDRDLQSLIMQKDFDTVQALLIGRLQKQSQISKEDLMKMIKNKPELSNLTIIANVDFGHTTPIATLPIGGTVEIKNNKIKVLKH